MHMLIKRQSNYYNIQSESESLSVVSNSLRPHGLYSPWNSPGQNTGVGSLLLLQEIFPTQESNPSLLHCGRILYQLSHKGSPRTLEWVVYLFSSRSFQPRNQTGVSCIAGGFFTSWGIGKAYKLNNKSLTISKRRRNILKMSMRTAISKSSHKSEYSLILCPFSLWEKYSLDKTELSATGHVYKYVNVCAFLQWYVHVCICVHIHVGSKDRFHIQFEL